MYYYKFNIGDYASHTGYLSLMEDLAYRRLLDLYYLKEKPIPNDPEKVARLIGMRDQTEEVTQILNDFFTLTENEWVNHRADEIIAEYLSNADRARANGSKGGRPPKPKENPAGSDSKPTPNPEQTHEEPSANPDITGSKANQEPLTIKQEPIVKDIDQSTLDPDFIDSLFNQYWFCGVRKVGKKDCLPIFTRILKKNYPNREAANEFTVMLINDVKERLDNCQLGFQEMHPKTYLNGERWTDENAPRLNQPNKPCTQDILRDSRQRDQAALATFMQDTFGEDNASVELDGGHVRQQLAAPVGRDNGGRPVIGTIPKVVRKD